MAAIRKNYNKKYLNKWRGDRRQLLRSQLFSTIVLSRSEWLLSFIVFDDVYTTKKCFPTLFWIQTRHYMALYLIMNGYTFIYISSWDKYSTFVCRKLKITSGVDFFGYPCIKNHVKHTQLRHLENLKTLKPLKTRKKYLWFTSLGIFGLPGYSGFGKLEFRYPETGVLGF